MGQGNRSEREQNVAIKLAMTAKWHSQAAWQSTAVAQQAKGRTGGQIAAVEQSVVAVVKGKGISLSSSV